MTIHNYPQPARSQIRNLKSLRFEPMTHSWLVILHYPLDHLLIVT